MAAKFFLWGYWFASRFLTWLGAPFYFLIGFVYGMVQCGKAIENRLSGK